MQVTLQSLFSEDGTPVLVETNAQATVQTLISSYCLKRGISYSSKYGVFDSVKRPIPIFSTIHSAGITNGQNLYIGYRNNSYNLITKWALYIAMVALVVGAVGILSMSLTYGLTGGKIPFDYGVVMDAGSSKTKTYLYHWLANKHRGTGLVERVEQVKVCEVTEGGIAKLGDEGIKKVLNCSEQITKTLNKEQVLRTPLYFVATAGMRLLKISQPDKADFILNELKSHLNESGLSVQEVLIIPGRDEGIYAWITTNFLKNTLDQANTNPWTSITYGALDLGGASTQIAFELPPSDENVKNTDVERITLFGEHHDVFAYSYLCFGRDEVNTRFQALLVTDPDTDIIEDPCAPIDSKPVNITGNKLFNQPCTSTKKFEDWISKDKSILNKIYSFVGTSDYETCKQKVSVLIDPKACDNEGFKRCFSSLPQQLPNQQFLAFAGYYYTTNFLHLTDVSLEEFENGTIQHCKKSRDEIPEEKDFAVQYCFNAVYIYQLLVNGYGFNSSTWKNINFIGEIRGKDIGWTLGYMINATNVIEAKKPSEKLITPAVLVVSLLVFIIVAMAAVIYIMQTILKKKKTLSNNSAQALYESP